MRILVVAHRFPPRHQTGAELYSWRLALELAKNHEIVVLAADDDLMKRNYSRAERPMGPLRVIEVQNHRVYERFSETYADPRMEEHFVQVLRDVQPDFVHFQHLLHHSVQYPEIARAHDLPSVLTLHEYWLLCGRNGQLLQADGERCLGPGLDRCARCLLTFHWGRGHLDLWMLRGLAGVRRLTGVDLKGHARRLRMRRLEDLDPLAIDEADVTAMRKDVLLREARVRDMFEMVDCFVAPSAFLRRRFIDFGLDGDRILENDYGTRLDAFRGRSRSPSSGRIRLGFIGSIQSVKGVHVLVQAMQDLDPEAFEARIWGDLSAKPEYAKSLRRQAPNSVRLMGRAPEDAVPALMNEIDVLVVPSIWWENSPIVIHEALAAGVPVVCSDIGGMAELIEDGRDGLTFAVADAADLARVLRRFVDEPELLERLRAGIVAPEDLASDGRFHQDLFAAIVNHHAEVLTEDEEDAFDVLEGD